MPFRHRRLGASVGAGALGLALGMASAPASATDWTVAGFLSERFTLDRDSEEDDSLELRSDSDLGVSVSARSPRGRLTLAPGVSLIVEAGEPVETDDLNFRFNGAAAYALAPRLDGRASLSVIPALTSEAQFADTGIVEEEVRQITISGAAALAYALDPITTLDFDVFGRALQFTDTTQRLEETRSFGFDLGLGRALALDTQVSLTFGATQRFTEGETDSRTWSLRAGGSKRVDRRLSLSASLGPALTERLDEDEAEGVEVTVVGDLGLAYRLDPTTALNAGLSQSVDQNALGETENQTALALTVTRRVNPVSSVSLAARLGFQNPLFTQAENDRRTIQIAPTYRLDLTPRWDLSVGYRFRASDDEDFETANSVFVQVSRNLSLLP